MTKEQKLAVPTIHLNGTSKVDLLPLYGEAFRTLRLAMKAVGQTCPNARDYYVQKDPRAFYTAIEQHEDRLKRLESVYDELLAIFDAIS